MSAATMGKKKSSKKADDKSPGVTLKVRAETLELAKKLAAMRGLDSLADLFAADDVMEFLNHLYAGELRKESERLEAQKKA